MEQEILTRNINYQKFGALALTIGAVAWGGSEAQATNAPTHHVTPSHHVAHHHVKPHHHPGYNLNPMHIHPNYSHSRLLWLKKLRICESGSNYQDTEGYYEGAYQFDPKTWQTLHTGYEHAYEAPPRVQDKAIIMNTMRSPNGIISQNPGCYQKLGLSPFPPK